MVKEMKSFRTFHLILLLTLIGTAGFRAQDDYQKWLKEQQKQYRQFLEEEDKKFLEFLQKDWKEFQVFQGLVPDEKPKPVKMPEYIPPADEPKKFEVEPEQKEPQIPEVKTKEEVKPKEEIPLKQPEIEPEKIEAPVKIRETKTVTETGFPKIDPIKSALNLNLNYFGVDSQFKLDKNLRLKIPGKIDNESIGDFWGEISTKNYKDLITQAQYYKDKMRLNDWGYFLLIKKIGDELYSDSQDEKHLFIWFILNKSGYKTKVGLIGDKVFLFVPTRNKIFGVPFFRTSDDRERLYAINFDKLESSIGGSIYTYEGDYPGAVKLLDMNIYESPVIEKNIQEKILKFSYEGEEYEVPIKYNKSLIDFYEYYPYSNLDIYFNAPVDEATRASLLVPLKKIIGGKSEPVAANMLLRFAQKAFEYKTDGPNFGREKPLFAEETLFYDYSDCEDRSILFSYLIRNLLGLEVIGLDYPGHIATAVKFNVEVSGDYITSNGKKYLICDPTYIGAYIGMCMPNFKGVKLEGIIELN